MKELDKALETARALAGEMRMTRLRTMQELGGTSQEVEAIRKMSCCYSTSIKPPIFERWRKQAEEILRSLEQAAQEAAQPVATIPAPPPPPSA